MPPFFWVPFLLLHLLAGACLGWLSGWLTTRARRQTARWKVEAALGVVAYLLSALVAIQIPWAVNTVTERSADGVTVSTTMNRYQHPERTAIFAALVVPAIYELRRRRKTAT